METKGAASTQAAAALVERALADVRADVEARAREPPVAARLAGASLLHAAPVRVRPLSAAPPWTSAPPPRAAGTAWRWVVGVEQYLKMFMPGRSNTSSRFVLAEVNALVSFVAGRVFDAAPLAVHPNMARKFYDITR